MCLGGGEAPNSSSYHTGSLITLPVSGPVPSEVSGSVPLWWDNFLAAEARRIAGTCVSCVCIRRELTTIVIHETKHRGGADGAAKVVNAAKQQELQVELGSHQ